MNNAEIEIILNRVIKDLSGSMGTLWTASGNELMYDKDFLKFKVVVTQEENLEWVTVRDELQGLHTIGFVASNDEREYIDNTLYYATLSDAVYWSTREVITLAYFGKDLYNYKRPLLPHQGLRHER